MDWKTLEKESVEQLHDIIYHPESAWSWLLKSTCFIAQRSCSQWATWQIAQALLFTQISHWPIYFWRQNLNRIRQWQHNNSSHAITLLSQPIHTLQLCRLIEKYGTVANILDF